MKMNCWMMAGVMLVTSAVAQDNSNPGNSTPAPTTPPPAEVAPAATTPEASAPAPAKKHVRHRHHAAAKAAPLSEPPVSLVSGPAQVAVKSLSVRAQAGFKGVVIGHVAQGETVTVLSQINLEKHRAGEPAQWAQIALPPGVQVWVFGKYINPDSKTVASSKLNLRAGPSENYGVLGVIERGTPVTEIRTKGPWMEIEPPTNAYAFVAAMYLTQVAPPPQPVAEQQQVAPPPSQPGPPPQPVNRVVAHEGVVGPVTSPVAPTKYKLYDPNTYETIDYLYTTAPDLDLGRYVNMRIIVTGVEGIDPRWPSSPIIAIQSIQVVSTNAVQHVDLRSPRQRGNNP
ncbi:MAG TPA: SH3 domain-containing protein [Candidatus Saccharimonadales bacterium]|nr:SH3 domain-containing protein [Candidatus Saccharimonadales bacterium]